MIARLFRSLVIVAALAAAPRISNAQDTAFRMEITGVGDSTFTFNSSQVGWVAKGQNGIVVDPRRRDVLVARFKVIGVNSGVGLALIVGQTQRVATDHMALLSQPQPRWYTRKSFWYGLAGGLAGGFLLGRL